MSIFKYIKNFILTYGIFSTSLSHAADISSAGVFSGTDSSTYLGYYYGYYVFSQKGTFIGVDSKFGTFTEATTDYGLFNSSGQFSAVNGLDTATFSEGKIFATFTGTGNLVTGGYKLEDSFIVTGGTGVFAGITGTVQDSDFYGNNGVMTGSYVANYSNIVSPVPLPGSFGQFGIALISLVGLGLKRVQHSNKA